MKQPAEGVTISDVKVTPYPRAGDNKEFEGLLDRVSLLGPKPEASGPKEKGPAEQPPIELTVEDVAEWVAWPFSIWAETQHLPKVKLDHAEAQGIAEPLTRILNRHGVADLIPPDGLDAAMLLGRLTPIMTERFRVVKAARTQRTSSAGQTQGGHRPTGGAAPQGAPATKPVEV